MGIGEREFDGSAPVSALPERARLLHVGLPKSGTTYLQRAAARNRAALLAHGVRYPGTAMNHRLPVLALMGKEIGWGGAERPLSRAKWDRLLSEVRADTARRIYISNESIVLCDEVQARRFVESLGDRLHVLVTVRGFAALLGSNWQQHVKAGARLSFESWLRAVLEEPASRIGRAYAPRLDISGVPALWARLIGPGRVTVVIADKSRPSFLADVVADLLALPRDLLAAEAAQGLSANRSMSMPEVELIRATNAIVRRDNRTDWAQYSMLIRNGATARMLQLRTPGAAEPVVALPEWAAALARPRADAHREALLGLGVRIVGDPESLVSPVSAVPEVPTIELVPLSAAAEAIGGAVSAATGRRAFFGEDPEEVDRNAPGIRAGGDPGLLSGALARLLGQQRVERVNRASETTRHIPPSRLAAVAVLRLLRQWRARTGA